MALRVNTSALRLSIALCLFTSLGSCGGGGGGSGVGSTPTPPAGGGSTPTSPSVNYDTTEYQRSTGSVAMNALAAYNAGATGQGVTVAVIDSGIDTGSAEFAGRISAASRDIITSRNSLDDTQGHGTAVSAIIGAARNDSQVMGVAFNSTLLALRTDSPGSCSASGCSHYDSDLATAIDVAVQNGARVINLSLGGASPSSAFINAIGRAADAGIIVVISAGNDGAANPDGFALVANNAAAKNMVVIAGSHDADGTTLSSFSNAAGSGQNHYLVALGRDVRTIDQDGNAILGDGTSFATPQVAGAAALLAQAFPNLTGAQIVDLLFSSAIDLGATGTDSIYGRGKLSLTKAFQPQGSTSLSSTAAPISLTDNGSLGAPMGDAARGSAALGGAIILDGYSRAYALNLASTLSRTPVNQSLTGRLSDVSRSFSGGTANVMVSISLRQDADNAQPWVGLAQTGMSARDARIARTTAGAIVSRIAPGTDVAFGFTETGLGLFDRMSGRITPAFLIASDPQSTPGFEHRRGDAMAVRQSLGAFNVTAAIERGDAVTWRAKREEQRPYSLGSIRLDRRFGPVTLNLGLGVLDEQETLLGSSLGPVFGISGATTRLADASASFDLSSKWKLSASVRQGWTDARTSGGLVTGGNLRTRGFSMDLSGYDVLSPGDSFGLRVSQPLRVEGGGLQMNMPVAYDYLTGSVSTESRSLALSPSGREINVEASYGFGLAGGRMDANAYWRKEPGHIAGAPDDKGVALRYRVGF
jgi:hypothetical protein